MSGVYLEAARRVAEQEDSYACVAIFRTATATHQHTRAFRRLFEPHIDAVGPWFGDELEGRNVRVVALCLMDAITKAEGQ